MASLGLGSRSICLRLEVGELGADRTLDFVHLSGELWGRGDKVSSQLVGEEVRDGSKGQ